jgi:hypothetical protein
MRQSTEFDDILNECLERVLHGGTVDECLSRFPQYADKLKPLLDTGLQVKKAASVQPRPEFRANARLQFQATLTASKSKPKTPFLDWLKQPQWAAVTAFALLVVLGTATAAVANGSMPDQPLYPVKLAMENIQISLTPSAESRGELYARFLGRRVDEIATMAAENKPDKIALVTNRLDAMVSIIAASTAVLAPDTSKTAAPQPAAVRPTAPPLPAPAAPALAPVLPPAANQAGIPVTAPPMAGAAVMTAPAVNTTTPSPVADGNITTLPAAGAGAPLSTVTTLNAAAANVARLRDLLASAPESERPALQNAVTASVNTYAALLKYLPAQ